MQDERLVLTDAAELSRTFHLGSGLAGTDILGRVLGALPPDARVAVCAWPAQALDSPPVRRAFPDAAGAFVLAGLEAGEVFVGAFWKSEGNSRIGAAGTRVVVGGDAAPAVTIELGPPALGLLLRSQDGGTFAKRVLRVRPIEPESWLALAIGDGLVGRTSPDGELTLHGLPAGTYELSHLGQPFERVTLERPGQSFELLAPR